MKPKLLLAFAIITHLACHMVDATQADETTIIIVAQNPGVTPFIEQLTLMASDTGAIKRISFAVASKPKSLVRPLSGTYSNEYLTERGYLNADTGEIFLPVYGLYAGYTNTVTLIYTFNDGSSKNDSITVTTQPVDDPCGYQTPTILHARATDIPISYDYMLVKGRCGGASPLVLDTDSAVRWIGAAGIANGDSLFFDNAFYILEGTILYRLDLDGTITTLHDYADIGITAFHHNADRGKEGLLLEADTAEQSESTLIEVDAAGNVLKRWDLSSIIGDAMVAGGDDPDQFVYPAPTDWFHNNAAAYNRADDSLIVSSRENFLIDIDYDSGSIRWILGDETKKWHQFSSLAGYTLSLSPGSLPPIGQHGVSVTYDQGVLMLDNGQNSLFQDPPGVNRDYTTPRKYEVNLSARSATEVWNYPLGNSVYSPFCGSTYEDAPLNYLVDYAVVGGLNVGNPYAQLLGVTAANGTVFYYQYAAVGCTTTFNAIPIHLERTSFPTVEPRALNLSTRGVVGPEDDALIGGFIVTGSEPLTVVFRALAPSLGVQVGGSATLADPVLTLFDSTGVEIGGNDDWESDPGAAQIAAAGLAPTVSAEAATTRTLAPGAYTFVVRGKDLSRGIGLVEAYDLSPVADARLANFSTRGLIGTGDDVLVSGFIIGDVANATVVLRALGPSLASAGIANPLANPTLTVYDINGAVIASNDNWQDDNSATEIEQNGLEPADEAESATILHLPAGAYTAIASPSGGDSTGTGLVEAYDLD
jgi:arylsulfate sulfotransferase